MTSKQIAFGLAFCSIWSSYITSYNSRIYLRSKYLTFLNHVATSLL
jgi:hypothetical protein